MLRNYCVHKTCICTPEIYKMMGIVEQDTYNIVQMWHSFAWFHLSQDAPQLLPVMIQPKDTR